MTISQNSRNWLKSSWTRFFTIAIMVCITLLVSGKARAQDVNVNCRNAASCILTPNGGIPWANGNITFIFTPIAPHASIYIYLHNNNPSNAHTSQSLQVFTTPFVSSRAPSLSQNSDLWVQDTVTQNSTAGASCNNLNPNGSAAPGAAGLGSCYVMATFATQVAIKMTGAAAQAGSPDTYDLVVVQEPSVMGSNTPGSPAQGLTTSNSGTSATLPIQVVSDQFSNAFGAGIAATNPGTGVSVLAVEANNGTKSLYFDKAIISCTAACSAGIVVMSSCACSTSAGPTNLKAGSSITPSGFAATTVTPTGGGLFNINLAANQPFVYDLRGIIAPPGGTAGIDLVNSTSLTGVLNVTFIWYEK